MNKCSIQNINSFGVDHPCKSIDHAYSTERLIALLYHLEHPLIIGGGSNVLFTGPVTRPIIVIDNDFIDIIGESASHVLVKVGAGTVWHRLVLWAVARNFGGIENLSLIPGKCGAAPMQNIGAYGVELKDVFVDLEAISIGTGERRIFKNDECQFGYRESIFKKELKDQVVITEITIKLNKGDRHQLKLDYGAIRKVMEDRGIEHPSIQDLSKVVMDIRRSKLPDPSVLPNAGSFFKNPIIPTIQFEDIHIEHPTMPHFITEDKKVKIPAGWLIEQCGWKGRRDGLVGTHVNQALVIVNYGTKNGREILALSKKIQRKVKDQFRIELEREVNVY